MFCFLPVPLFSSIQYEPLSIVSSSSAAAPGALTASFSGKDSHREQLFIASSQSVHLSSIHWSV